MIRGIAVQRANVALSVFLPVQWSQLLQLAVNNGSLITVLDPKLPLIHSSIIRTPAQTILDLKQLFDINTEIHVADIIQNENRRILDAHIVTYDQKFLFGNFLDIQIVSHNWTPIDPKTRSSYLVVLLNTSELLVLGRETVAPVYRVVYNVSELLIDKVFANNDDESEATSNGTNGGSVHKPITLTRLQYESVKIVSFAFTSAQFPGKYSRSTVLTVATVDGGVTLYILEKGLQYLETVKFDSTVTKLEWSPDGRNLIVVTSLNEVYLLTFNDNYGIKSEKKVLEVSRFLVSKHHWLDNTFFAISNTVKLMIYNDKAKEISSYPLISNQLVTGIIANKYERKEGNGRNKKSYSTFIIHITFESGECMKLLLENDGLKLNDEKSDPSAISNLISRNLFKYQMDNSMKPEDNKSNFSFFNDVVEGKYYNYGTVLNGNVVAVVSRIVPKRTINYLILSKVEYLIDFIPVKALDEQLSYVEPSLGQNTSLGRLNQYWINHISTIPTLPYQMDITDTYIGELEKFVDSFKPDDSKGLSKEFLVVDFWKNEVVNQFQITLVVNTLVLETVNVLKTKLKGISGKEEIVKALTKFLETLNKNLKGIEDELFIVITQVVKNEVNKIKSGENHKIDDYIANCYGIKNKLVSIKLSANNFEESFEAKKVVESKFESLSLSKHIWRICNLTLLPIIQTSNRTGETGKFVYVDTSLFQDSILVKTLTELIQYCIYSGNRTLQT